jgi:Na+/H+ antiporter NhaC
MTAPMGRVIPFLVLAALAAGLFFLPPADPARLAALDAWPQGDSDDFAEFAPIATAVLEGPDVTRDEAGQPTLALRGVRLVADRGEGDLTVHGLARRSIVRGLRQVAAANGESLSVEGELAAAPEGGAFLVTLEADTLRVRYEPSTGEATEVARADYELPERSSLFPPLIAILVAILFRRPVLALFAGVWSATFLLRRAADGGVLESLALGVPDIFADMLWPELTATYRIEIVIFVFAMLAMVGVMTRSGGMRGLMDLVAKAANDVRSTQLATWLMGLVVFFDDYANCIMVGSTMRPLTDRFRISREKLAYLVDSTAAPVAGISIFSTWIAFEVSTFSAQLPAAGLPASAGYQVFIETLPFRFYCLLSLFLGLTLILTRRDFGPMLAAERRARSTGQLVRPGGRPMVSDAATSLEPAQGVVPRAHRAVLPVLVFVVLTLLEIVRVGLAAHPELSVGDVFTLQGVTAVLGDGNSTHAIMVGSLTGMAVSMLLALSAGLRSEILSAAWSTIRAMGVAVVILYLAWMIGRACGAVGTAPYLSELLGDHLFAPLLPCLLFLLGALVAFSTGSSWSTMSILLPLVVGLAFTIGEQSELGGHLLMVMSIGAVLEGSIFGDHCSPISDTTVLSSTASASDHIDHVRTQAPYALMTMAVALLVGYVPCTMFGWNPWLALLLSAGVLVLLVRTFGRRVEETDT